MMFPTISPPPTWDRIVTVLNKRAGRDSADHLDAWKVTVLNGCFWMAQQAQSRSGETEIDKGASYLVRVPQNGAYRPYREWKETMEGFTFSTGDYVLLGEVAEEVTPETVQQVVEARRPDAFEVQFFKDNTAGPLAHYRIEGA